MERNAFIIDYVRRHSVRHVEGRGWTWKFDKSCVQKNTTRGTSDERAHALRGVRGCPCAAIYGERSAFYDDRRKVVFLEDEMRRFHGRRPLVIWDAAHHIMSDQPLQTIQAIQAVLNGWEGAVVSAGHAAVSASVDAAAGVEARL